MTPVSDASRLQGLFSFPEMHAIVGAYATRTLSPHGSDARSEASEASVKRHESGIGPGNRKIPVSGTFYVSVPFASVAIPTRMAIRRRCSRYVAGTVSQRYSQHARGRTARLDAPSPGVRKRQRSKQTTTDLNPEWDVRCEHGLSGSLAEPLLASVDGREGLSSFHAVPVRFRSAIGAERSVREFATLAEQFHALRRTDGSGHALVRPSNPLLGPLGQTTPTRLRRRRRDE